MLLSLKSTITSEGKHRKMRRNCVNSDQQMNQSNFFFKVTRFHISNWWSVPKVFPCGSFTWFEVFAYNTDLSFLAFLYVEGFQKVSAKNKVALCGNWTHNTNHDWIQLLADLTLPICHSLPVLDYHTLIKSCCIESRNNPSPISETELKQSYI